MILDRSKLLVPSIINGPEVISSISDKAKIFTMSFASNSMQDDMSHPLPDFPFSWNVNFVISLSELRKFPDL